MSLSRPACVLKNRPPFEGWAVFSLCVSLSLFGCADEQPSSSIPDNQDPTASRRPSQVVEDGYFEYTERGKVIQSLRASRLERWESKDEADEGPSLWHVEEGFTLFIGGTQNRHSARLSAVRGTYDDQSSRLEAWEEVVLVNQQGERLLTEHLIWSHDSDLVHTDRPVEIETAQGVLRGRGLRADSQFEKYEILAPTGSFDLGMDSETSGKP